MSNYEYEVRFFKFYVMCTLNIYRERWMNSHLNNTKMKITLTSLFIRYIYQNYMKIFWNKVKLATVVEGEPKALFSVATTPRTQHLSLGSSTLPLIRTLLCCVKQGGIKYHFLSLWYDSTWDWTLISMTTGEYATH